MTTPQPEKHPEGPSIKAKPSDPPAVDLSALSQLASILVPIGLTVALADFLFWDSYPGLSVGVFFVGLAVLMFTRQRSWPRTQTCFLALLLAATCVQCAIGLSLSNLVAAAALTVALAGNIFQPQLASFWARISEALFGVLTAPIRWLGLGSLAGRGLSGVRVGDPACTGGTTYALQIVLPAAVLLVIFGTILANGNAAFGNLLDRANSSALDFWKNLDLTPLRLFSWAIVGTIALGLFHGTRAPQTPRWWTLQLPRVSRSDTRLAIWQTALALLAMNGLFCMVNTLDAIFLWGQSALPAGVNPSDFLHSGVNSLIIAVILSAIVITAMFQQADNIAASPWLKRLAHLWVLQNFVLIAGVLRRLLFYTQSHHLTEKRIYVACFLLLAASGFFLLAWFVQKRQSLNWLIGHNLIVAFALFFILQFLDIAGWVARYNVARWQEGGDLDVEYLASLGPTAWPELIRVSRATKNPNVAQRIHYHLDSFLEHKPAGDWRAYQWWRVSGYQQLLAYRAIREERK